MYIKNYFKLFTILFIVFLLTHCEKENEIIEFEETTQQVKSNVNYISSAEVPEIVSSLERALVGVDFYTSNFTKSVSSQNTYIDYNKIMEVVSTNKATTNFTFNLGVENAPDNEFYNLIVHKNSKGSIDKPYVIRYIVNPDAMSEFIAHNRDFRYFKGSYKIESFNNFFNEVNLKATGDCPNEGDLDSGGSLDPDTTFGSGDTIDSEGGLNGITITSSFGSLLNNDNTGSYIYQINDARNGEAISGTVSPATALDVSYTINGTVTSISVPVGNDTTNVSVTINTDSSGCVTLSIIVGDIVILEFVDCPDVANDFDKSTSTTDCPDPDGEIGLLPHPFLGCLDGYYLNPIDNKCYKSPCTKLNSFSDNIIINQKLKVLATSNHNYEEGFKIQRNPTTNEDVSGNIINTNVNCSQVRLSLDKYTFGIAHSHPTSCDVYGMFSAADILLLAQMAKTYSDGNHNAFNEFVVIMAYDGASYALKFDNQEAMNALIAINDDRKKRKKFVNKIESIYERLNRNIGTPANVSDLYKGLLQYFNNKNLNISLFKAITNSENLINGWEKKRYENNQIQTIPCN